MKRVSIFMLLYCLGFCSQAGGQSGIATTVAGNGILGSSGDGGPAASAELNLPIGVAVDATGNLFIADYGNNLIRMVSVNGIITTVAGGGVSGDGGPATSAILRVPRGVAVDAGGNLFIADTGSNRLRKVSANGIITTVAGIGTSGFSGDGGPAAAAALSGPTGVAVDAAGNLFIADLGNSRVRKVSADGIITTVAGNGTAGFSGNGGTATSAEMNFPAGVAVDAAGNLFIVDQLNNQIRKVSPNGIITTVAGNGTLTSSGDGGLATSAGLITPAGVVVDAAGNLLIADQGNARIRQVSTSGFITTVAGNGTSGFSGDGGPATSAELNRPMGIALDAAGNLFIAEYADARVRKVAASTSPAGGPALQTVTFVPLSNVTLGVAPFTISATASSGLAVTFASITGSICTVSGSTVTITAVGTCSVTASQAGNADYAAAAAVTQSFTVGFAPGASPQIQSLRLSPDSVASGRVSAGSIVLFAAAPSGGAVVALSSSSSAAYVPASVTVPAGSTSATFTVYAGAVASSQTVAITASYSGTSVQASLTVTSAANSQCTNLSGNWSGSESGSYTVNIAATTETDNFTNPVSGKGSVTISQTGCSIQYNPITGNGLIGANLTPSQLASLTRTGSVSGNNVSVTGLVALVDAAAGLPGGFSISNISTNLLTATGQLAGDVITLNETGTFVASGAYPAGSFTITITTSSTATLVSGAPLQITTLPALPLLTMGALYSQSLVASGGNPPYTWSLISGALPAGLQMSSTGVITGTPTTIQTATFTVRVTDTKASTATQTFIIGVQLPFIEYPIPTSDSEPYGIAKGPDGALWFTELGTTGNKIGRITTAGLLTEYPIPTPNSAPREITVGPDGALWFTESAGSANKIGRITTAGVFTEYPIPTARSSPTGITTGPDGALWFIEGAGKIGRMTTAGSVTEYQIPSANSGPNEITVGPDGALWFTEGVAARIGRITTAGVFTEYPVPSATGDPYGITAGPDGALWFTEAGFGGLSTSKIGRITTTGSVTEYLTPSTDSGPGGIVVGPDGALWFTEGQTNRIGRITTAGVITEYPSPGFGAELITVGPDGALWFTEYGGRIGRTSIPTAGPTVAGGPPSITSGGIVPVDSPVNTIQPGEWVSIFGANLASSTANWNGDFQTSLGGTGVTIDGKAAYLLFVSPTQINVQAPNDTATGSVPVVVTTAAGTANSTVTLARFAPSLLLLDSKHPAGIILRSNGSGAYGGGSYDIIGPTGNSLGYPTVAARAGDFIELFGIGFGPTSPVVQPGQAFSGSAPTTSAVTLRINNVSVSPAFAGLTAAGVYQINLTVPATLGTGDLALVATVGGFQTPPTVVISLQ